MIEKIKAHIENWKSQNGYDCPFDYEGLHKILSESKNNIVAPIPDEQYSAKMTGFCECGKGKEIVRFVNSNLSIFDHGDRYTYKDDILKETNIYRCEKCIELIHYSFKPKNFIDINYNPNP